MRNLIVSILAIALASAPSLSAQTPAGSRQPAVDLAAIDAANAAQIAAESDVAVYFPAIQRMRYMPAADAEATARFVADLERDFPSFRRNTFGPYILKQPAVARPLPLPDDAAAQGIIVSPAAAGIVFNDSFESGLSQWKLADDSNGKYTFAASGCGVHSGTWGADTVRNGTSGQYMFCSDPYPKSVTTQIAHASCDAIQGAAQAWLDFYFTADMDSSDSVGVYYLASDGYLWGYAFSGTWSGWYHVVLNLKQWNRVGDLTAQSCPKVYFQFSSGTANTTHAGTRIDDVTIRTDAPPSLKAAINATPTTGPVPLTVNFSPAVSGSTGGETYQWSFGDQSSSTATTANATFVYATAGTYWPRLRVIDSSGTRSYAQVQISATAAGSCTVSCGATVPSTGTAGSPVAFAATATATGCSSSPTYAWNFGDGTTSTQQNPSHTYASAGSYAWSLTVSSGSVTCSKSGTIAVSTASLVGRRSRVVKPPTETQLSTRTIGPAGGTLSGGGLTLTVPSGAFVSDSTLSLTRGAAAAADNGEVSDTYVLTGLPQTISRDLTVEIQLPSTAPSLAPGESYYLSIEAPAVISKKAADTLDAMMPFLLKPTVSGTKLSVPITTSWGAVKSSSGSAAALAYAPTTPVKVKALKLTVTETDHFTAPALTTRISSTSAIVSLLEQHYQKLTTLGFSLGCRTDSSGKFRKILVSPALLGTGESDALGYHVGHDDPCGNNLYFYDYLQITISYPATDEKVKAAAAHELFHLVQDIYSPGGARANLWLKEASSTWLETEVTSLCPDVESAYREFAFNGMFNSVNSAVPGFFSSTREQRHGYGGASMLQYRTGTSGIANDPFVRTIWDNVKSGQSELKAFETALGTTAPEFWREYARKYFYGTAGGKCQPAWSTFPRVAVTDTKTMTQATKISAYPLSAKSWNVDLMKFSATPPVPAVITAAGLIDKQSVYVYDVKAKSEIAELTKDSARFAIDDLMQKSGSVLVLVLVDRNAPTGSLNSQGSTNEVTLNIGSAVSLYAIGVKEVESCGDMSRDWGTWGGFLAKWSGNSFEYTETTTSTDEYGVVRENQTTIRGTVSADRKILTSFSYDAHGKETYGANGATCPVTCTYEVWKSATLANLPAGSDWQPAMLIYKATGAAARSALTKWSHRIASTGWKTSSDNFDCTYPLDETKVADYTITVYVN